MSRKFEDLVALQARLRAPGGCPWDREQTHESLRTYLLEEAYEVLDRLEARDFEKLPDELGDLLLQVVFHAQLASETGRFDIGDVIEIIHDKLVRRHPHVFGDVKADTAQQVRKNWEELKAEERKTQSEAETGKSVLDGVPKSLPALLEAYQLTRRAANIGFDWVRIEELFEKLHEETDELKRTLAWKKTSPMNTGLPPPAGVEARAPTLKTEEEVGDLLFVTVNIARFLGVDPEIALKKANRKFKARFHAMEAEMEKRGSRLADAPREEMERLWEQAKQKG